MKLKLTFIGWNLIMGMALFYAIQVQEIQRDSDKTTESVIRTISKMLNRPSDLV